MSDWNNLSSWAFMPDNMPEHVSLNTVCLSINICGESFGSQRRCGIFAGVPVQIASSSLLIVSSDGSFSFSGSMSVECKSWASAASSWLSVTAGWAAEVDGASATSVSVAEVEGTEASVIQGEFDNFLA